MIKTICEIKKLFAQESILARLLGHTLWSYEIISSTVWNQVLHAVIRTMKKIFISTNDIAQ